MFQGELWSSEGVPHLSPPPVLLAPNRYTPLTSVLFPPPTNIFNRNKFLHAQKRLIGSGLQGTHLCLGGQQHLIDSVKDPVGSVVVGQGHDRVVVKRYNGPGLGAGHVEDLHQDFLALQGGDLLVVGEVAGGHVALCHVVGENFGQKRHIGQDLLQSTGGQALKGEVVLRGGGGAEFARVGWVRR